MAKVKKVVVLAKMAEGLRIESKIRHHTAVIDQPKEAGGQDGGPTPLEYLFFSLAGCICAIARIIAGQKKINLRSMEVRVEGELDLGRLMGMSQEYRTGFSGMNITAKIDADMSKEEKEQFLHEVDARCPVSENLRNLTPVSVKVEE